MIAIALAAYVVLLACALIANKRWADRLHALDEAQRKDTTHRDADRVRDILDGGECGDWVGVHGCLNATILDRNNG